MATNLRDRGYGSSMDAYNANKQKVEERKKQEKTTGPVSTLRLPQVNSTTPGRAASTSAPIQTQRFYNPNSTFNTTGHSGGRGTPRITPEEFMRSTAMQKLYGNYNNYANGIQVTGSGFSDPNLLFNDNDDNRRITEADAIQNKMDQAMNVVADNFGQKASAYERWYRTATNNVREKDGKFYRDISDEQLAEGDRLYADYEQALNTYSKMEDAHRKASANTALTYSDISGKRQKWYDSIRDVPEIDLEEKDIKSRMEILQNEKMRIENESANAKLQTLHGITTAPGLETVMNSTDDLNRIDRQLEELQKQLDLLEMEKSYSRYFKWQELKDNDMPVSARRLQGGAPSWLHKIISGTATQEDIQQAINEGNINPSNIAEMLDDEKETYLSIWEQYGPAKANEYVDELERYGNIRDSLNTRRRMTDEAKLRNWVKKGSPFGRQFAASVLTVLASPMKAFSYVGQGADYLFSGEMTKDADYNVFSYAPNAVTAQIGENITKWGEEHGRKWVQKWGEFGYQTALSIATFLYTTALTGGFGLSQETMFGVELYNQGYRTAEAVSAYKAFKTAEALSLGLMGTEAAADAVMQAKDRGLDDGQAFWMGTAAGAIEILTEKFSVENLLEGVGDRSRLLSFLKSMFTEGSEEVASDLSNMLVDSLVAKDKSEFNQSVKNYMKEYGVSKQEALKAVWTEQLKSIGLSGLGGAISGGFMGGANIVRSGASNLFNRSAITSPENVTNIINRAQGLNEWSAGARSASALQRKLDAGERFTIREVLKARNAIETDRKTDPKYVGALIETAQDYGDSDAKKQADKLQTKLDTGKVKVEDVENLEEAIDLERLVDPNREDLQAALKYGETADQKSEAYVLTKGIRDKIAAGEKLSLEEVSAAESAVSTARATSAEGLKSTIESGLASDQNSPAYRAAQQLQSKLDSGTEITLAEVNEAKRAVRAAENAAYKSLDPNVVGKYLVTENGRQALTDAATILKNSTSQSDIRRGNEILQAIKDGSLDAKTAGEVFLRSQNILENTRNQTARVLQPREATADMDAYDRSAAKLGVSVEEAAHNKAIMQAFGVDGEYKAFENNNLSAYYDRSTGKVYINANAQNPGLSLIAHEVTHSLENTAGYKKLADLVFRQSTDLNADLQRITQEYADAGIDLDDVGARSELVSEFVEQHMFNDEKFINDVVSTDRSLGQKILRTLDNLLAKLGNKNAQQRQLLRHARDLWAEALQQRKTSDKAKAKIAEKRSNGKLTLPAVEAKAAAVRKTEGPNLPKAENRKIQVANAELNQYGINIDADSGAAVSYSIRTAPTTVDEIKLATDRLVNAGFDQADAENWLKSLTSVSSVIMQNMLELDYETDERYTWLKTNSEYTQGSVDFNNNCPKRAQFTAVFDRLQQMMPDRVFSASDYETIRQILIKHNISVTCGPCFVEDRQQHTGEIAQKFIDQLKSGELKNKFQSKIGNDTYIPTQYDLVTYEGLRGLYDSHRGIHDAFVAFNNARGMQAARLLEGLAEYNNQIKKWNKRTISSKNSKGGLRIFSLSDADPRNMIDMIQIVTDSAEKGLMIQGYTKKPWFARFIKDTGVRILRSHIPAGNGVRNGKLVFDNVEGINTNDPDYFDATNERNIGDTVIGINDEMIRIAMADPSIDQIIPFHTQLAKDIRDQKKIGHWTPYNGLEDRNISDGKKADKQINIYKDVLQAWEKKGTPITNRQEFVEAFLQVCDERGLIPRFDKFLNTDENGKYVYTPGYEKFLVDYKLFDRTTGEIIPQEAVKPIFDDAYNQSVLENYVKGAKNLPKVSEDVFDEIKRHFTDDKLSLPKAESKQYAIGDRAVYIKDGTDANGNSVSFTDLILDGQKLGETRNTRNLPVGEWVGITKGGKNPAVVGRVIFGNPIRITNQSPEYADAYIEGTNYDLKNGESKWYYPIEQVEDFRDNPRKMTSNAPVMGRYQYAISKSDTAYLKAVESGDMETAQRMVDEAAASAMPNSVVRDKDGNLLRMHHGTDADFTVFDRDRIGQRGRFEGSGFNFTPYDGRARGYGKNVLGGYLNIESPLSATKKTISITKLEDIIRNIDPTGDNIIANYARDTNDYGSKSFVEREARTTARAIWKWANNDVDIYSELSAVSPDSDSLIEYFSNAGYDGVIHYDEDGRIRTAVAFDSNQFKLTDPVTYDDSGNPIPLSERFNPQNDDIRYAISKDAMLNENLGYHAGDLGKAEYLKNQGRNRGTGHFGTGTYFVGTKEKVTEDSHYGKRPQHAVDFSDYNLYKVRNDRDGYRLHDALQVIDGGLDENFLKKAEAGEYSALRYTDVYDMAKKKFGENLYGDDYEKNMISVIADYANQNGIEIQSREEYLKDSGIDEDEEDADFYYLDYLKETVQKAVDEVNDEYSTVRKAIDNLEFSFHFDRPKIIRALNKVLEYQKATPRFSKSDSYATVFMKAMGYDGVDVRGTGLDNTGYGSVIYDVKKDTIRYAINKDATIRTESELIDSIIDPKETAKAGVENALDGYLDSIGAGSDIPGMDKISTGTKRNANLPAKYKAQEAARFFYRKMVDSGEAVTRLGRYSNDPHLYHYYNMARASSNAAVSMIQDAQTDVMGRRVGDSLNDIFSAIRKKGDQYYADLQAYLFHTHNIDRMSRANPGAIASAQAELEQFRHDNPELANMADFQIERMASDPISFYHDQAKAYMQILRRLRQAAAQHNKPVFGQEVSAEQSRRAAEDLREKLSETEGFEEDVEKIYQYIDNLMQYRIDSGLITEDEYERLKEIYPHYVPTFREQEPAARNKRGNTTEIGKTVGRAQGGDTRLIPLHRALAQQTFSVVREGSKNRFGQMLLEGKQNSSRGMIKNVEEAESGFHEDTFDEEDPTPTKENTFIVRQGGKRYEIGMDNALYEAVTALSPEPAETNFLINMVHKSNDLFKALCTGYNPTFLVRNFMRDLQDAGLYSKDLSEFSKNYPLAYKEITTNGKYWQMYKALGGLYSSFFDYQTGELKQPGKVKKYTVDAIESVNMAVEQAPRLAEFMATVKKAEKAGNLSMDTLMEAIYNAADVTVNFGRSGKWGKMFNRSVVPFFNPGVQGFDKMIRNVTETKGFKDWARLAAKATILGIAPAVISRLLFGKRKDWDEIKQRDKDIYYLFPLQDGVWLKLPKGRVLSVFGMAADRIMQGKDADWASFIETSLTQTAPENPLTASYWRPWLDAKLFDKDDPGKTWYGSDIENQRLRNLAPGQRYDTTTDALSKWLGKTFNLSPKKINYLLDQYSGVIGDVLLPLTSDRAEKGLFTNAFTIDSVVSNQLSEDFYDMKDRLTWAKNDPNATGEDEALYKYWNEQTSAISDINKAIRAIEQDKSLTDKEKRDLTRVQYSLRNGIMRNALDSMSDYRAGGTDNDIYSKVSDAQAQEERESKTYNFKGQDVAWDDLSGTQKKIVQAQDAIDNDPNADLSEIIGKGNATKKLAQYQAARDQGISNQTYIDALQAIDDADDGNGNYNQAEAKAGLDKLISDGTISEKEAGTLWKIITGGADKNNPFPVGAIISRPMGLRLPKIG